jgi:hypothetical protein
MLPIYTNLFNKILETGLIPTTWSNGYIIHIYKGKGSTYSPENYRPITILSCLSQLFTSALKEADNICRYLLFIERKPVWFWEKP